ncbi:DUF4240 domain-containing protein [Fusobacterium sp. PH5-44]|uniref:DUF4240 domain-containing protein n=1 Tax=unclassified Fusobacterium TaxID=2648384 RepID=UPI003D1DDCAE
MKKNLVRIILSAIISVTLLGGNMTNQNFWAIINETYKEVGNDEAKYLEILNEKLYKLDDDTRYQFQSYVGYYAAKAEENNKFLLLMKVIEGSTSDDSFLYFCLWLVSRGEHIYFETLKNPDNFIKLVNPNDLPKSFGSYYAPGFEMLMTAGRKIEESYTRVEIPDEEQNIMDKIYNEKVSEDDRSYTVLAKDIDNILPETVKFFKFDKKKLDAAIKYEKIVDENYNKMKDIEKKSFDELGKKWKSIELQTEVFNIARSKRDFDMAINMPPHNDNIIFFVIGADKNGDFVTKNVYWYNYKTKDTKNIDNYGNHLGSYLASDEENIYFLGYTRDELEKIQMITYNFASNSMIYKDIEDPELKGKSSSVLNTVGKGKNKSGFIHDGKLYFSLSIGNVATNNYKHYKDISYVYDIKSNEIKQFRENEVSIQFIGNNMYYLKVDETKEKDAYDSAKTLISEDLSTGEKKEIAKDVYRYSIDKGIVYYSQKKDDMTNIISRYSNDTHEVIFENIAEIREIEVAGDNMYLSLFMTAGHGGYIHAFILNLKDNTMCEVPKPDQTYEAIFNEEKYITIVSEYDDNKISYRIYEVKLK